MNPYECTDTDSTTQDDITLVIDNAILYNQPNTAYHKTAVRIRSAMQPIFEELDCRLAEAKAGGQKNAQPTENENGQVSTLDRMSIGNLEPPLEFLKLLTSIEGIQEETDLDLDKNPLDLLFSFELAKLKPPPPLPSPKPVKPKRDRKADLERKRKEREAEAAARALLSVTRPRRMAVTATIGAVATLSALVVATEEEAAEVEREAEVETETETEAELAEIVPEAEPETGADEEQDLGVEREQEQEPAPVPAPLEPAPTSAFAPPPQPEAVPEESAIAEPAPAPVPVEAISEKAPAPFIFAPQVPTTQTQGTQNAATVRVPIRRGPGRRQSSLPSPSDAPPLVTDVDNKGSFQLFDKGWILPPEQKRGGRRPVERQPLPPKKRVKTGKRYYDIKIARHHF